jgi:hypothetical protein
MRIVALVICGLLVGAVADDHWYSGYYTVRTMQMLTDVKRQTLGW